MRSFLYVWVVVVSIIFCVVVGRYNGIVDATTVSVTWGGLDSTFLEDEDKDENSRQCVYKGKILLSHPMSVSHTDKHYVLGSQMLKAAHMTVDRINRWPRCGVSIENKNYSLTIQTYGDESEKNKTAQIGRRIVNATHIMLAGYSSSLTASLTPIAQENRRLCVTGGSSRTSVHAVGDYIFGLNPPSKAYLEYAFKGAHAKGARTVAYLAEDTASACSGIPEKAEAYDMELLNVTIIPENGPFQVYEQVARNMSISNPDLMITCVRTRISMWNQAMRLVNWTPKAQVYTYVIGAPEFENELGPVDLPYVMGVSSWDRALPPIPDAASGWTPGQFDIEFQKAAFRPAAYQHVQQSAVISVLVQAIQQVNSPPTIFDQNTTDRIRDVLATNFFPTVYGNVSFDENGQNAAPFLLLQYDANATVHVLLPEPQKFTDFQIVYPIPTWAVRDCRFASTCIQTNGTCAADGTCNCTQPATSTGIGPTATCNLPPEQATVDANYTTTILIPVIFVVLVGASLFVYYHRSQAKNDSVWQVEESELHFAEPVEIIGRGTFGMVLLAEYRGTQVAVKRVVPPKEATKNNNKSKRTTSSSGRSHFDTYNDEGIKINTGMTSGMLSGMASGMTSGMAPFVQSTNKTFAQLSIEKKMLGFTSGSKARKMRKKIEKDFVQEMRYVSKLRHPCITTVMGAVISPNEEPMLVMEYMDRGSFYDILHNDTMVLDGEILLNMLQDISQGCRFLHAANPQVIHGDLKAANILVDRKFRAKVADFGLSQKKQVGATGTPFWMAPELLDGSSMNTAESDVYSYGIILYEAYSRKDPYEGEESVKEILEQVADRNINRRPPIPRDCPPAMSFIMTDCLVADPDGRPSFEELDKRLKRVDFEAAAPSTHMEKAISLFDIFPKHIAEALKDGKQVEPEHRECVTIFFSDIVGFTNISSTLHPRKVANMLDRLYQKFDTLSDKHDVFKVETIGDAYMAVTNLVKDQKHDHARRIAEFAVDAIQSANETLVDTDDPEKGYVNIRVGFHSGPVVADVVGSRNPRYCLFGDTVNTANRMESNSEKNRIHCSKTTAEILMMQNCKYPIRSRGNIQVKGKGKMHTYWVNEVETKASVIPESPLPLTTGFLKQRLSSVEEVRSSQFMEDSNEMSAP